MTLDKLSYLVHGLYYNGIVKSNSRQLSRQDMLEYCKIAYANVMRNLWERYKKTGFGNEYYFFTGSLARKELPLGDVTANGRRTVDMSKYPVIRLPKNMHIFNLTPINKAGCNCGTVTQVAPAEERFYGAEFSEYPYFSSIGSNIDCYNFPDCIKEVEVEAVFDDANADIPNDIAADVVRFVLFDTLKVKNINVDKVDDGNPNELMQVIKSKLADTAPN
jgi:hypothetical protein